MYVETYIQDSMKKIAYFRRILKNVFKTQMASSFLPIVHERTHKLLWNTHWI